MAWTGAGGGVGMGGMFGGGAGHGQHSVARDSGLPFAGIPADLADGVSALLDKEPHFGSSTVAYSHRAPPHRRLTLRSIFAPERGRLAFAVLLVVIEALSMQAGPFLAQIGIDRGVIAENWDMILLTGYLSLAAVVVTTLASAGRTYVTGVIAGNAMYGLRVRVFSHLQRMSLDYYTDEKAGVILTRMTSDIEHLQQLFREGLVQFALQILTMSVVTAVLFAYDVELALVTVLAVVPLLAVISLWFRAASEKAFLSVRDGIAGVLSDLSESLAGVRVVAAFNRQRRNVGHHRNVLGTYRDANDHAARLQGVYGPGSQLIGVAGQGVVLLVGGMMVRDGELSVGELTAFVLYLGAFFQPIQQLVQLYNTYQQGRAALTKLDGVLATVPSVLEAADAVELPPVEGRVVLDHVSFGYDADRSVLHSIDLEVAPGETVCLVGPTGAGKSTVAKLITRFYDPTGGSVSIDGYDLRSVSLTSLRRQLGVVPQEPFLFAGSLRDNLTFADRDATDADVDTAVEMVGLTELVARMPHGLETEVHERGVSLSSGERQLIALARAFLARPRVLVLDEATSSLDLQSETRIEAALDVLLEGRTAVIVAHRLSTAMRADRIVVIDDGRIIEHGKHHDLISRSGRYASMFGTWASHALPAAGAAAAVTR